MVFSERAFELMHLGLRGIYAGYPKKKEKPNRTFFARKRAAWIKADHSQQTDLSG